MTESQESLPFVVLAGVPEIEISKLKNSIDVSEFQIVSVPDVHALLEKVPDPRCFLVVFCDSLYRDALGIMNEGYSLGTAKWILYSKIQSTEFRTKAENAGAALVFEYPVNGAKIGLRARHPEIIIACTQASAIAVNDVNEAKEFGDVMDEFNQLGIQSVAAIPVFSSGRVYAMVKARFGESMSDYVKEFLADLAAYCVELEGEIQEIDFFARIYRSMPKSN